MATTTSIEWTRGDDGTPGATWNPVTGCDKITPGCVMCYASTFAERWRGTPGHYFEKGFDIVLRPDKIDAPKHWRKPRRIFVNSMSDLFHDDIPTDYIARVFAVMAETPHHTYQLLTKRHGRMRSLLNNPTFQQQIEDAAGGPVPWPLNNLWLGVSVEDQKWANTRIPALLDTPATIRWISAEPLLGPINLWEAVSTSRYACHACEFGTVGDCNTHRVDRLSWVVCGGESGPGARPMDREWARGLVAQCRDAAVPVFVKQMGSVWAKQQLLTRTDPKGGDPNHWPEDLRVRQYPTTTEKVTA